MFKENMLKEYPDCLTVENLQEVLHLGRTKVYYLLRSGKIKTLKVGKKYIIPKISVIDYILKSLK